MSLLFNARITATDSSHKADSQDFDNMFRHWGTHSHCRGLRAGRLENQSLRIIGISPGQSRPENDYSADRMPHLSNSLILDSTLDIPHLQIRCQDSAHGQRPGRERDDTLDVFKQMANAIEKENQVSKDSLPEVTVENKALFSAESPEQPDFPTLKTAPSGVGYFRGPQPRKSTSSKEHAAYPSIKKDLSAELDKDGINESAIDDGDWEDIDIRWTDSRINLSSGRSLITEGLRGKRSESDTIKSAEAIHIILLFELDHETRKEMMTERKGMKIKGIHMALGYPPPSLGAQP